jgi:DNA-binding LytR/AlgR family response regulator
MNVVIIEDEIQSAWDIENCLTTLRPNFRILATLDSVETALEWFSENPAPDLIISDIQLGDGLSFEVFRRIELRIPIIFCTAFDEYAIQAFESNGIDYILKPINEKLFEKSLGKLELLAARLAPKYDAPRYEMDSLERMISALSEKEARHKNSFLIAYRNQLIPIETQEIALFKFNNGSTELMTRDGRRYGLNKTLDSVESQLDPRQFYRANRQYIVAYKSIRHIEHYEDRKLLVKLDWGISEQIIISKAKASEFLAWMEDR